MKRLIAGYTLAFLLFVTNLWAAAPSRTYTYTALNVISPSEVTTNEDNVFNYLSTGVEVIADNTIVNADINSSAAIAYSKLSLGSSLLTGDIKDGEIVNADISSSAGIVDTKLATISTAGKVSGGAITTGSATLTALTTGGLTATADLDIGTYELRANTLESDVATGTAPFTIASTTVSTNLNADLLDGLHSTSFTQKTLYTSSDTFTAPTGVSRVYVTMVGGGGGGKGGSAASSSGGGGGSGASIVKTEINVTAGNGYTVTVGAAGSVVAGDGTDGGNSSFAGDNTTVTCNGGSKGTTSTGGAGGTANAGTGGNNSGSTGGTGGTAPTTAGVAGGNGEGGGSGKGGGGGAGSLFGKGGAGATVGGGAGSAGTGFGSGGGGGESTNGTFGGAGTAGAVLVEW